MIDWVNLDEQKLDSDLSKLDLTDLMNCFVSMNRIVFPDRHGMEHYKLLAYISTLFQGKTIYDIGTHYGNSAIALAYDPTTRVVSYDIENLRMMIEAPPNVEFRIGDFRQDKEVLSAPFIFVDVDPHDGIQETEFHKFFIEKNYKGITVWDDINHFDGMRKWWDSVNEPSVTKIDISKFGHWSGTGMIIYN